MWMAAAGFDPNPNQLAMLVLGVDEKVPSGDIAMELRRDLGEDPYQLEGDGREVPGRGGLHMPNDDGSGGRIELQPLSGDGGQPLRHLLGMGPSSTRPTHP